MRNVRRILLLVFAAALFCGCAFSADVPREPPQMNVRSQAGETGAVRFGWNWYVQRRWSKNGWGMTVDSVDPLLWEYEPIPVFTEEDLTFVFPEGREPDGVSVDFYPFNEDGEADWDSVYRFIPEQYAANPENENTSVVLRNDADLHAQDGIFVVEAKWNKTRYRGEATYAFAVTPREIGE